MRAANRLARLGPGVVIVAPRVLSATANNEDQGIKQLWSLLELVDITSPTSESLSHGTMANGSLLNGAADASITVYNAASVEEIRSALAELGAREANVTARLDDLLASQKDLNRQLGRLDLARAQLGSQVVATRSISNGMLSSAASTAHRISGAVKKLDREQAADGAESREQMSIRGRGQQVRMASNRLV